MAKDLSQIALFDMDDTLFDHNGQLEKDYRAIKSPGDPDIGFFNNDASPYIKERIRLIRNQAGWWRDLEPLKSGFNILEVAKDLGFYINIATKGPGSATNAWSEKKECIEKHIGKVGIDVGLSIVTNKSTLYGRVLVDDYPEYLESWLKTRPRGIGIMPAQPHNVKFKHKRVVRYNMGNLEKVREAMTWARDRDGPMPKF